MELVGVEEETETMMAKKRKMSGTDFGYKVALNRTKKKCADEFGEDRESCRSGAAVAHSSMVKSRNLKNAEEKARTYCNVYFKDLPADRVFCEIGAFYFSDSVKKLSPSLAGKKALVDCSYRCPTGDIDFNVWPKRGESKEAACTRKLKATGRNGNCKKLRARLID